MKRLTIGIIVCSFFLIGCASKIVYGPSGVTEASNYTIMETVDQNGKVTSRSYVPFIPDRWYSDALDKIGPLLNSLLKLVGVSQGVPVLSPTGGN